MKKLTKLICMSKPFQLNMKELSTKIEIDRETLYLYMHYLHLAKVFNIFRAKSKGDNIFLKPEKVYLNNSNLNYSYCGESEIGTIRETFFANQLGMLRDVAIAKQGDFIVDDKYTFEIGGKNKTFKQTSVPLEGIKDIENSFVIKDDIEDGFNNNIPLWLFGFLY